MFTAPPDTLPPLIASILSQVERLQRANDSAHRTDHIQHVLANCRAIFQEVACDQDVVLLAACLHDVVPRSALSNPGDASNQSAQAARDILLSLVQETTADRVMDCIRTSSWEYHVVGGAPATVESRVLRDADLLESIGARGLARAFAFAGSHDLSLKWTNIDPIAPRKLLPEIGVLDDTPFRHFETKLLWVHELMFSNTAKLEAERRHRFLLQFLNQYKTELNWGYQQNEA